MTRYLWFYWAGLAIATLIIGALAVSEGTGLEVVVLLALAAWTGGWVSAEIAQQRRP